MAKPLVQPDPPARLPVLQPDQFDEAVHKFLGQWTGGFADPTKNHPLLTFAHHPRLGAAYSRFNLHLLTSSTLPVRQRQIAILRTAWQCKSTYIWSSHLRTSMHAGLETDVFAPIQEGASSDYFSDFEKTILRATDELVNTRTLSSAMWNALTGEWNDQQMLDFLFTVGCYVMLAGVMGAAGTEREPELLELAARFGAP